MYCPQSSSANKYKKTLINNAEINTPTTQQNVGSIFNINFDINYTLQIHKINKLFLKDTTTNQQIKINCNLYSAIQYHTTCEKFATKIKIRVFHSVCILFQVFSSFCCAAVVRWLGGSSFYHSINQ